MILGGIRTGLASGGDLNNYTAEGKYRAASDSVAQGLQNSPTRNAFVLNVYDGSNSSVQQVIPFNGNIIYMRRYQKSSDTWRAWYVFEGTVVE